MPVADPKGHTRPSVAWRPLNEEAAKQLTKEAACFVWLNLTTGELDVRATDELAASPRGWWPCAGRSGGPSPRYPRTGPTS